MSEALGNRDKAAVPESSQFLTFSLAGEEYGVDILKIQEIKGYVPTVGSTFKILTTTGTETGTFATVNGLTINGTEAYTVTYQPTDVLLTVVSAAAPASLATRISDTRLIGSEDARLTSALREFNAGYVVEGTRFTARNAVATPRALARTRMMDLVKELHR